MTRAQIKTQVEELPDQWATQEPNTYELGKINAMRLILESITTEV